MTALFFAFLLVTQSPNTSTVVVIVTDQTGAVVPDAQVSIVNGDIAFSRDAATGSITLPPCLSNRQATEVTGRKQGMATGMTAGLTNRELQVFRLVGQALATFRRIDESLPKPKPNSGKEKSEALEQPLELAV